MEDLRFEIFGCDIGARCRESYREPCHWDVICVHCVVVGCVDKDIKRKCVSCGKSIICETKKLIPRLSDPDFANVDYDPALMMSDSSPFMSKDTYSAKQLADFLRKK
uniref:Uncharacterized protein n=1 Tax=viral metagenome TaxID=1070528 RepID=A0A6M3L9Q9_9ZZZZ